MTLPQAPLMPSLMDYIEDNQTWTDTIGERLYPVQADQDAAAPWASFKLKKEVRDYAVDGPSELNMPLVEFTIASDDYREAHRIARLLMNTLDGYRGTMGDIVVIDIRFMDSRDGESKDEVLGLYLVICEVSVWYTDA